MSEGDFSAKPAVPSAPTDSEPSPEPTPEPKRLAPGGRRALIILAALLGLGVPLGVGIFTFMNPTAAASEPSPEDALDASASVEDVEEAAIAYPLWTRPGWADSMSGTIALELPSADDVLFANGRLRPTLGMTCSGEGTSVHIVTGGTALVDPQTSGHVVHLTFDDGGEQSEQWTATDDMRALFAPAPREFAHQMKQATRLSFGFSHYMSGPITIEFDLRGADTVIDEISEPCGWTD
jgi:hypothetical protein